MLQNYGVIVLQRNTEHGHTTEAVYNISVANLCQASYKQ